MGFQYSVNLTLDIAASTFGENASTRAELVALFKKRVNLFVIHYSKDSEMINTGFSTLYFFPPDSNS